MTHVFERRAGGRFLESAAMDLFAKPRFKTSDTVSPGATRAVRGIAGNESSPDLPRSNRSRFLAPGFETWVKFNSTIQ